MSANKRYILLPQVERCLSSDIITRSLGSDSFRLLSLGESGFSTDDVSFLLIGVGDFLRIEPVGRLKI